MRFAFYLGLAPLIACTHVPVDEHLVHQLDGEVAALQEKNAILTEKLAACPTPSTAPEVYKQLTQVFTGTEVSVARSGSGARVTFPAALLFSTNSLDVRQEAAMSLDLVATAIKLHPELTVRVTGYSDIAPTQGGLARAYPTAWEWSTAEATAVMRALHGRFQVPFERFWVGGRGAVAPVSTEDTPEARASNRRVEILLGPSDPG